MKRSFGVLSLTLIFIFGLSGILNAEVIDRVVAQVNDKIITLSDVKREGKVLVLENPERFGKLNMNDPRAVSFLLNQMISTILIEEELKKMGRGISIKEVNAAYNAIKRNNKMNDEQFEKYLKQRGLTPKEYRKALKQRIERIRFFNATIKGSITISDKDVKAYFEKHKDEFVGGERVQIAQIFVPVPKDASNEERLELQNLIMKIEGEIYKGKNFFAVLKKYKDNPQVKVFEDMGWYKRKDLVKPIADVAFKLKKGAVSEVIETKLGFHIIKVLNIQRAKGKDFKDVKAKIEDILFKKESEERMNEWLDKAKKQADIEIML
jgi:peptidyl-prolyl cis-trans isomerase SurA